MTWWLILLSDLHGNPLEGAEHGAWQALPVGPLGPPHASESSFLKSGVYDGATCSWDGRGRLNECPCKGSRW